MIGPGSRILLWSLVFAVFAVASACDRGASPEVQALLDRVPELSPQMARHLIESDDSTLAAYVRHVGHDNAAGEFSRMWDALPYDTLQLSRMLVVLLPPLERLAETISGREGVDFRQGCRELREEPYKWAKWKQLSAQALHIQATVEDSDELVARLSTIVDEVIALGDPNGAGRILTGIGDHFVARGRPEEAMRYYRQSLRYFEQDGKDFMVCQILGVIGSLHGSLSHRDSMIQCWDRGLRIAHDSRDALQAARLTSFFANYYASQGRLALAHDLFHEAIDVCRRYGGRHHELRFVVTTMNHYARLEAWDAVGRMIPRARILDRDRVWRAQEKSAYDSYRSMLDVVEGRYLFANGRVAEANRFMERAAEEFERMGRADHVVTMSLAWGDGLLANGDARGAHAHFLDGEKVARANNNFSYYPDFALARAKAQLALGDRQRVGRALADFEATAREETRRNREEWLERDLIRVRLALTESDTTAAYSALAEAFGRLNKGLGELEPSVQGYLMIGRFDALRQVAHDMVADEARLGYGLEFCWRDMSLALGDSAGTGNCPAVGGDARRAVRDWFGRCAHSLIEHVRAAGAYHLVYAVRADEVWRWTVSESGIHRDVIPGSVEDLRQAIETATRRMGVDPGDADAPPSKELIALLRDLGTVLLPPEVLAEGQRPIVYFSTEGMLAQLPFESLDVSTGDAYMPLLERADVAYLRRVDVRGRGTGSRGIVLVNAECNVPGPMDTQRLPEASLEGDIAASLLENSVRLEGDAATKDNLMAGLEQAPHIYMATHVVRDPEVPYLMHVQLTPSSTSTARDASLLDVGDIRGANLSACRVVVLSGCSSGAPYVGTHNWAPSLGDAFLDAGAGVAIQTFWDVRDDAASELMSAFVEEWKGAGEGALRAVCDVRRRALAGPNGARHPYAWAAYSVNLGRL